MRRNFDAYDTPPALALAGAQWCADNLIRGPREPNPLLAHAPAPPRRGPLKILDPMAGGGPWVKAAREVWPDSWIAAIDIRAEVAEVMRGAGANWTGTRDLFTVPPETFNQVDLVLTNPAFVEADRLLRHLYKGLRDGAHIAFLLNVTFIGSDERWDREAGLFVAAPPRYVLPVVPRPSFLTVDGRDTSPKFEAALFVWTKGYSNPDVLCTIPGPLRWVKTRKAPGRKRKAKGAPETNGATV